MNQKRQKRKSKKNLTPSSFFVAWKIKFNMKEFLLSAGKVERNYKILKINLSDVSLKKQLQNLGFLTGEKIKILNYNYGKKSFLVKVMGVNYAIDKNVCEGIVVEDE